MEKLVKKFGVTDDNDCNLLLHSDGTATACIGSTHEQVCKTAKTTLYKYMDSGGCRVKVHGEELAVESLRSLSDDQKIRLRSIVRKGRFALVIIAIGNGYVQRSDFDYVKLNRLNDVLN